jgi:hypothetical protein
MLRTRFEEKITLISNLLDKYPFEDAKACHRYFSQQYYLIQNSTRYEAIGASLLPLDIKDEFKHRITHLTGEFNHDDLIISDLIQIGFNALEPMYPQTRALIECTYYELQKYGADALFGISLLLEGLSTRQCAKVGQRMLRAFDFHSQYLEIHDEADAEHYPETMQMVEAYSAERKEVIVNNLELSFCLYKSMIEECLKLHSASKRENLVSL